MQKTVSCLTFSFLLFACGQRTTAVPDMPLPQSDNTTLATKDSAQNNKLSVKNNLHNYKLTWYDSLVIKYLRGTGNELIRAALKDTVEEQWLLDDRKHTDTADYLIFHIGHDFQNNFITDGWLYIDSISKRMYEYDVAGDNLKRWQH